MDKIATVQKWDKLDKYAVVVFGKFVLCRPTDGKPFGTSFTNDHNFTEMEARGYAELVNERAAEWVQEQAKKNT